jgi:hypothetical protein
MTSVSLYQINIRQLLYGYGIDAQIQDIPLDFWEDLSKKGMTAVWLMGVWQLPNREITLKYATTPMMMTEYRNLLPDITTEQICGSVFAIDSYTIDTQVGSKDQIIELKTILNTLNIQLILDFIPNHFHCESQLVHERPELFVSRISTDASDNWFQSGENTIAHGKDPHFSPWSDTAQLNYSHQITREYMKQQLIDIAQLCDGVRCDMSMLVLKDVFVETWKAELNNNDIENWHGDFWRDALESVKLLHPQFFSIAEVYWGLEDRLLELGFDVVYDKLFLEYIRIGNYIDLYKHISTHNMKQRLVFIENHDEERSVSFLSDDILFQSILFHKSMPTKLYQHGQFEGEQLRIPVQIRGIKYSKPIQAIADFYQNILA